MISKETTKELLKQINSHSGEICQLIFELKGFPSTSRGVKLKEEIAVQNECIQDVMVSFHDLYLAGNQSSTTEDEKQC